MRKITALFTAALLAASVGITAHAEAEGLVVLGDSITSGYGLDGYVSGDNYSAAGSFANRLGEDFTEYSNFAVDGRTSGELLTALDDEEIAKALEGADTVVVSIGGNDFLQPMLTAAMNKAAENPELLKIMSGAVSGGDLLGSLTSGGATAEADGENYLDIMMDFARAMTEAADSVDIQQVVDNIDGILGTVSARAPESQIIVLTVYNPFEGVTGMELFDTMARTKLEELNSGIATAAENNGAQVADVNAAFAGHALEYTNISRVDIHPNEQGHGVIYQLLLDITGADLNISTEEPLPADEPGSVQKGSPDTGAEGFAVVGGIAALAGAFLVISRKRS